MNKKVLIVAVILLLLAAAGLVYSKMQKGNTAPGGSSKSGISSGSKSLKDLLTSGVAQKCTYSTTQEGMKSEGTTYVSGGKVRGDFSTVASGKTTVSHMIVDGKTNYIWTDGSKTGFKTTIEDTNETATPGSSTYGGDNTSGNSADLAQQYDYKCSAWVVDSSLFTPPADVVFSDFSSMIKPSAPAAGQGGSSAQCAYCNNLTGNDKAQCLSSLNCN